MQGGQLGGRVAGGRQEGGVARWAAASGLATGGGRFGVCHLVFVHELLHKNFPDALLHSDGASASDIRARIDQSGSPSKIIITQPALRDPLDEDTLMKARRAFEDYLIRHLRS